MSAGVSKVLEKMKYRQSALIKTNFFKPEKWKIFQAECKTKVDERPWETDLNNKDQQNKENLKPVYSTQNLSHFFLDYSEIEKSFHNTTKHSRPFTALENRGSLFKNKLFRPTSAFDNLTSQQSLFSYNK